MNYSDARNFISLASAQECLEHSIDRVGCRGCPQSISLEQENIRELKKMREGSFEEDDEVFDEI